jgi:hypothetical protein
MNKRQLRANYRKYLFSYTFEAVSLSPTARLAQPTDQQPALRPRKGLPISAVAEG